MPLRARLRGDDIVKFNPELRSTASACLDDWMTDAAPNTYLCSVPDESRE